MGQLTTAEEVAKVFTFKVVKKHTSSINRIIRSGDMIINSKEEYSRCSIPTLMTTKPQASKPEPVPTQAEQVHLSAQLTTKNKRPRTRSEARSIKETVGDNKNTPTRDTHGGKPNKRQCTGATMEEQDLVEQPEEHPDAGGAKADQDCNRCVIPPALKRSREAADLHKLPDSPAKRPAQEIVPPPLGPGKVDQILKTVQKHSKPKTIHTQLVVHETSHTQQKKTEALNKHTPRTTRKKPIKPKKPPRPIEGKQSISRYIQSTNREVTGVELKDKQSQGSCNSKNISISVKKGKLGERDITKPVGA